MKSGVSKPGTSPRELIISRLSQHAYTTGLVAGGVGSAWAVQWAIDNQASQYFKPDFIKGLSPFHFSIGIGLIVAMAAYKAYQTPIEPKEILSKQKGLEVAKNKLQTQLQSQLQALNKKLEEIKTLNEKLKGLGELNNKIEELKTLLNKLEEKPEELKTLLEEIKKLIEGIEEIKENLQKIEGIEVLNNALQKIEDLNDDLQKLSQNIEKLEEPSIITSKKSKFFIGYGVGAIFFSIAHQYLSIPYKVGKENATMLYEHIKNNPWNLPKYAAIAIASVGILYLASSAISKSILKDHPKTRSAYDNNKGKIAICLASSGLLLTNYFKPEIIEGLINKTMSPSISNVFIDTKSAAALCSNLLVAALAISVVATAYNIIQSNYQEQVAK